MIANRRLIATIRGRATAGDPKPGVPLAAQPPVVRALFHLTLAVGAAGVICAGFGQIHDGLMSTAASAAVAAGGGVSSGGTSSPEVSQLAASTAVVEAAVSEPLVVPAPVPPVAVAPAAPPAPIAARRAPTPAAPAPTPPAPGSVEAVIAEVFREHAASAIGVARCESRLNPGAISRGGGNLGLFQINTVHRARVQRMGFQWEQLLDARVNALVARSIFDEQGWRPWACRHAA